MNKDNESRGFNPKQRIIGAVILVVLAIIIVPLVLNKREPPADADAPTAQTVIADLPPADAEIAPATPPSAVPPPEAAPPGSIASSPEATPNAPAARGTLSADIPRANTASPTPVPTKPATPTVSKPVTKELARESVPAARGWYVQVGTFSNPTNAERLAARLQKAGFKVVLERLKVERNTVVRVRVGPYAKEAQAKTGQTRVHKAVGIQGLVRHY